MSEHKHSVIFFEEADTLQVGTEEISTLNLHAQCPECNYPLIKPEEIKSALETMYSDKVVTKILMCYEHKRDFLKLASVLKRNGVSSSFF